MSCAWFEPYSEGGPVVAPTLDDVRVEHPAPGQAVAVFAGEHDLATKQEVRELLTSLVDGNELVVADFSRAQFVDASILGVLTDVHEAAEASGRSFRLQLGTADIVRRAFEICGVFDLVDRAATREAALGERG